MIRSILRNAGIQPKRWLPALRGWSRYARDRRAFRSMADPADFSWGRELPILGEWDESAATLGAYFFQDQIAARWIYENRPVRHVDIGSRIDGFVGHLAVFREVEVIDIRPLPHTIPNIRFHQLDLMGEIPPEWIGSTDSLSCLHTIEHFGLGRYGDKLDPEGHLKGLEQLKRMVAPGGRLYLSTPVGRQRVEFNAHRIFSAATVLSWFREGWSIERSAVIDDALHVLESDGSKALREAACDTGVGILCARKAQA
jgi:SAM-dependent methyltransferase